MSQGRRKVLQRQFDSDSLARLTELVSVCEDQVVGQFETCFNPTFPAARTGYCLTFSDSGRTTALRSTLSAAL
jgi:hypothetical protein